MDVSGVCNTTTDTARWLGVLSATFVAANLVYQQIVTVPWKDDVGSGDTTCDTPNDLVTYLDLSHGWVVRTVLVAMQVVGLVSLLVPRCLSTRRRRSATSLVSSTSSVIR